jgi:hypothetical protein
MLLLIYQGVMLSKIFCAPKRFGGRAAGRSPAAYEPAFTARRRPETVYRKNLSDLSLVTLREGG